MNWKKAGVILVTIGVTATVGYVGYSYITSATKKNYLDFIENCKDSEFVKSLSDSDKDLFLKNISKISKKELAKLTDFVKKEKLSDAEQKDYEKIINKLDLKDANRK